MSGATGADAADAFALLLRELKDRSGLSYGALAKRLHMSTSTLHRYCNGTVVPVEYAPVERLARVCRATPQELVELHRRWVLADAARASRGEAGPADTIGTADPGPSAPKDRDDGEGGPGGEANGEGRLGGEGDGEVRLGGEDGREGGEPVVVDVPPRPAPRRRRTVLIASAAAVAVLGAAVLAVRLPHGDTGHQQAAGAASAAAPSTGTAGARHPSAAPSPGAKGHRPSASASAAATESASAGSGSAEGDGERAGGAQGADGGTTGAAVPLTVHTRPYVYDTPCSQHFLVDSAPAQVGPPAMSEQDAPRWAAAYGAVSSGEQEVALTVQGTGTETVVLEALHVRVLSKGAPLAWNDYSMGVGCGGNVGTKSFGIDLDEGSPTVTVQNGQRDFPYKVSESDPEVFYVFARTTAHDVRWDLTLDWSSGSRRGTVRVDNAGTAFRTSADAGRPGYDYPLGGGEWVERDG
ncbi:helix-turn-helix domain-containing protein [Streptomyces shenzhenensis]|uniref:helix-turn-helix domain-containing protein n=1 Tax=Streptomyces shenzhenensis TaxID=943815 RepID=UPI001F4026BE|nr:helix-turn-helix transcriptional regulator [Streptomyces shenzhenensis]